MDFPSSTSLGFASILNPALLFINSVRNDSCPNWFYYFGSVRVIYKISISVYIMPKEEKESDKFLLISLEDEKSKAVAEVLSSKTCKKIIGFLAETKEASEKDLSEKLGIPMNTAEYNLRKLVSSGFVQKRNNFFWSKKGKKIAMYELSNKSIVISPKKASGSTLDKLKSITPAIILSAAGTFAVWAYGQINALTGGNPERAVSSLQSAGAGAVNYAAAANATSIVTAVAVPAAMGVGESGAVGIAQACINLASGTPLWLWFLAGSILAIAIISVVNWRKL